MLRLIKTESIDSDERISPQHHVCATYPVALSQTTHDWDARCMLNRVMRAGTPATHPSYTHFLALLPPFPGLNKSIIFLIISSWIYSFCSTTLRDF